MEKKLPEEIEGCGELNPLESLFQRLTKPRIFKNRNVLYHDYIPAHLPHREEEVVRLAEILLPSFSGFRPSNVFIYGKPGTGKTAVVKYVLNEMKRKARELKAPIVFSYINCRIFATPYKILSQLCEDVGIRVPFTGLSLSEIFDRFRRYLSKKDAILITVLDEIDHLVRTRGDDLLYNLTRINENLESASLSFIGISNDLRFKDMLGSRVLSSLSQEEIVFKPYSSDELRDILSERAELAFCEGVLTDEALNLCAALAAIEHGDARRALDLLRVAGDVAEREGSAKVTEKHVRQAQQKIEYDRVSEVVKTLPLHSKLVLLSVTLIQNSGIYRAITGDIYNVYRELCAKIGVDPLTQRRISGLINELDSIGVLNAQVISFGRYGRTKKVSLGLPPDILRELLSQDNFLGNLVNYVPSLLKKRRT